ncbi:PREDICTED: protein C3orf33 homolog, partial [Cariama cristata]|uniref:protein C3orf33 homolog n=1 Tax=Cariama cristata TaxID=54380 RepID=UPI000520AECE
TTKFTSALDIPVEFVEKNVKLRGKLHHVTEKGLEVEHIPISIPFLTSIQRKSKGLLLVRLAGVELAPRGMAWLQQELKPKQMIWFQLLGREDLALECLVLVNKGRFLSVCLNEEILRQGLGRTARIEGLHHDSRLYWKLHKRLLRAELRALKKNKGIWKEESYSERIRGHIRDRVRLGFAKGSEQPAVKYLHCRSRCRKPMWGRGEAALWAEADLDGSWKP